MKIKIVKSCDDCPALWQNMEFPESRCQIANRSWGMGHYEGGPSPDWCPLRKETIQLKLQGGAKN